MAGWSDWACAAGVAYRRRLVWEEESVAVRMTMPKLGMTMEEGTINAWFKAEGDLVREGEPLLSVLTDKVDIEVDAPASGVLRKILVPAGATVPINTPIAVIADAGEDISGLLPGETSPGAAPAGTQTAQATAGDRTGPAAPIGHPADRAAAVDSQQGSGKVRATPVARRLAAQWGLDLAAVAGSGPRGRVTRADVEAAVASRAASSSAAGAGEETPAASAGRFAAPGPAIAERSAAPATAMAERPGVRAAEAGVRRVPLSPMRRVIAERMVQSAFSAPHVTLTTEADVTELVRLRQALHDEDQRRGGPGIGYIDLFVRIAARALEEHPGLNGRLEGETVVIEPDAHIGVAVALTDGLVVPVIREANRLNLGAIARERHRLVAAARGGTLLPGDVHGGTFTITNLGAYEIDAFTPIINPPQTAILGLGRIVAKPWVHGGEIAIRSVMVLSLSFDHRVVDGAPAAAFLRRIKELAERPELLHL